MMEEQQSCEVNGAGRSRQWAGLPRGSAGKWFTGAAGQVVRMPAGSVAVAEEA